MLKVITIPLATLQTLRNINSIETNRRILATYLYYLNPYSPSVLISSINDSINPTKYQNLPDYDSYFPTNQPTSKKNLPKRSKLRLSKSPHPAICPQPRGISPKNPTDGFNPSHKATGPEAARSDSDRCGNSNQCGNSGNPGNRKSNIRTLRHC